MGNTELLAGKKKHSIKKVKTKMQWGLKAGEIGGIKKRIESTWALGYSRDCILGKPQNGQSFRKVGSVALECFQQQEGV